MLTVRESVRYRGWSGHYSWIAHRISGLAILFFLTIHVWDTANAHFWPEMYEWTIAVFKYPPIAIGEIPLMAAVLYHAFNGIRITILDFKPEWWKHQRTSALITWGIFAIVFIPIGIYMFTELIGHCNEVAEMGSSCWTFPNLSDYLNN
jgi:succinate dehydrogenase / fumarate reductase cytochrome b subunit